MKPGNVLHLYRVRIRARLVQELFALAGIAAGVALLFASQVASQSLSSSVTQLSKGIVGDATLQLLARDPHGMPERVLAQARAIRGVRVALALLLLLAVGGLTPLAYASPPDPAWIRGIYDDADYDDVVDLVTSALAATAPVLLVDLRQTPPLVGPAPQLADDPVPTCSLSSLQSRAPPAA